MDGLILVHKPDKLTSHDVVDRIREILGIKKVGHFGTLDPFATGLIIVAVGKATRFFPFYLKTEKSYTARIRMGLATDTYDLLGKPVSKEVYSFPTETEVQKIMKQFCGQILQVPPRFSAKKIRGKPLYVFARENKKVELKPNTVFIHRFELQKYHPPHLECSIQCSSGTYIRSLAHDLGQELGCGAHLIELTRTAIGPFVLENSFYLEEIAELAQKVQHTKFLLPLESLLPDYPKLLLTEKGSHLVRTGGTIYPDSLNHVHGLSESLPGQDQERESIYRLFSPDGTLVALARLRLEKKGLHPFLVVDSGNPRK
jgi:tRNA pseudouridine55 synthase